MTDKATPTPSPASVDSFMSLLRNHENRISETYGVLQDRRIPSEEVRAAIDASSEARNALIAEVERLAAQAAPTERDAQDAARYRWLRSVPNAFKAQRIVNDTPHGMDATIDAAMNGGNQ